VRLLDALEQLDETDVTLIVREGEEHNDFVRDRLPEGTSFLAVDDLHAKVVVCDEFVYLGSANITRGGLGINREVCEIVENEYQDTAEYLERELDIGYPAES
jgi:phosphatidylserine/phosphatidylglycerophosphate/cardiolipin synthase-like enzyme